MIQKYSILVFIGFLTVVASAAAGPGTVGMAPTGEWAVPLSDSELAILRGGVNGLTFSVFFSGFVDRLGNTEGNLVVGGNGTPTPAPSPEISVGNEEVRIRTHIGEFNGASGIFQIAQVPGSFNVVNNNLFVQINIFHMMNGAALPNLSDLMLAPR